jgi:hypothetical protein
LHSLNIRSSSVAGNKTILVLTSFYSTLLPKIWQTGCETLCTTMLTDFSFRLFRWYVMSTRKTETEINPTIVGNWLFPHIYYQLRFLYLSLSANLQGRLQGQAKVFEISCDPVAKNEWSSLWPRGSPIIGCTCLLKIIIFLMHVLFWIVWKSEVLYDHWFLNFIYFKSVVRFKNTWRDWNWKISGL